MRRRIRHCRALLGLTIVGFVLAPVSLAAHPLGNFSISQYTAIQVRPDVVELRYFVDMAEIPTFQEIQETGIVPEVGHASLTRYLARKGDLLKEGLLLEVEGRRLQLQAESSDVIFPAGAGGLPTLKLGVVYRARLADPLSAGPVHLRYRDGNFAGRAGWKEIIAVGQRGITLASSSVPEKDQSHELSDYPTDLLNSPPQDLEARVIFKQGGSSLTMVPAESGTSRSGEQRSGDTASNPPREAAGPVREPSSSAVGPERAVPTRQPDRAADSLAPSPPSLQPNKQGTPRNTFTDLLTTKKLGFGFTLIALAVAASLGAFHALEPGHGKTVVAAYLVGSRGTAWHALWLGLIVTASHTAGVYLLGAVTLYASRYVLPEQLYPWLGTVSGLAIAGLGFTLFLRRYADATSPQALDHFHDHGHSHHHGPVGHSHGPGHEVSHTHAGHQHHHHEPQEEVSLSALVTLGVTGGIVPCPAALVVLLSALSLNRVGFGLLLIVAFSVGLAAVLIAIGMLMVYARRFMARFQGEGPLINRWLPLTSSAVITLLGLGIAVQALVNAGILQIRL